MHPGVTGLGRTVSVVDFPTPLCQEAQAMFARILSSLCLRAMGSAGFGRAVNAAIVLASRDSSPREKTVTGRAGAMVPIR